MSEEEKQDLEGVRDTVRYVREQTDGIVKEIRELGQDLREGGILSRRPLRDRLRKTLKDRSKR